MRPARKLAVATVALATSVSLITVAHAEEAAEKPKDTSSAPSNAAQTATSSSPSSPTKASQLDPEKGPPPILLIDGGAKVVALVDDKYVPAELPPEQTTPVKPDGNAPLPSPAPTTTVTPAPDPAPIVVSAVASMLLVFGGMMAVFKAMFPTASFKMYDMPDGTLEPYRKL
ncbi:hypothetical protein KBX17_08285 [Corynebacterium sp. CCUG 65737]|uniref:hypothetical protein n=1 Tax=unclassified Corynebacterium TaxID=2624378 RepID=UPI00210EF353|nr:MULTISPECIES: hypothetical protein [unclassified Corynebacterium]MCQ4618420.1 hypothetical protein [Corynebacterium pseudogenitalium]MCQ4625458.1 hypothetical protein [Corynebacterium sp. CCUG 69979]MCQ4627795.1 hypothetical protein [Corynebacterium sp. CCUG 65737]